MVAKVSNAGCKRSILQLGSMSGLGRVFRSARGVCGRCCAATEVGSEPKLQG